MDGTPSGFGTSTQGVADLLNAIPGVQAEIRPGMTPQQMADEIRNGNQVTIAYTPPGGGGHRVVVRDVQIRPDGRAVMTIDDPQNWNTPNSWVGGQWQRSNTWFEQNGWSDQTVVAQRR
jgi:hypothetical protein